MKIALCVKQVPDTTDIKWTQHNTIQREGVESVINPYDVYALELALKIKRNIKNVSITAFTMGPSQAESMLRRLIALGCDDAVLISDKKFAGADTYATALTVSEAIKKHLSDFDIVICGQFAVDGDTAQTGPNIASFLNIPQVTYTKDFIKYEDNRFYFSREMEDGVEIVKTTTPFLACVLKQDFEPTRPVINGVISASKKSIKKCSLQDLMLDAEKAGIKGSPTYVSRAFRKVPSHEANKYVLDSSDAVSMMKEKLSELGVFSYDK